MINFTQEQFETFADTIYWGVEFWVKRFNVSPDYIRIIDEENQRHIASKKDIETAATKYYNKVMDKRQSKFSEDLVEFLLCEWDAADASNIFQMAIYNEIVYC